MSHLVIFIFRRDLRFNDNKALTAAHNFLKSNPKTQLFPVFIFNENQINPSINPYYSTNTVRFMIESLRDLDPHINTFHTKKSDIDVLEKLREATAAVFFNRDFSPYARKRDEEIIAWCNKHHIHIHADWSEYSLITDIPNMPKPYKQYGAFLKAVTSSSWGKVENPINNEKEIIKSLKTLSTVRMKFRLSSAQLSKYYQNKENPDAAVKGGRAHAQKRLELLKSSLSKYAQTRDYPSINDGTTMLSAYLKYGCISIREFYKAAKESHQPTLIRELYWRAYYEQMAFHFPHTLDGQLNAKGYNYALNPKNDATKWNKDAAATKAIMSGTTGIPFVDAGVNQLITTGFMHNRLRMIVAMLACRILKLDWRVFERWFATHLIDYYSIVNRMSWEWAVTYRFTLNPWVQSAKFDKDAIYIKRWLPELKDIPAKELHKWYQYRDAYKKNLAYAKNKVLLEK